MDYSLPGSSVYGIPQKRILEWVTMPFSRGSFRPRDRTWSCIELVSCIGRQGNGNPLQYSCLRNSMDRGARWAAVHRFSKSQTQLSDCTFFTTSTTWEAPGYCLHTSKSVVLISGFWILPLIELVLHLVLCHPWLQFFPDREGPPDGKAWHVGSLELNRPHRIARGKLTRWILIQLRESIRPHFWSLMPKCSDLLCSQYPPRRPWVPPPGGLDPLAWFSVFLVTTLLRYNSHTIQFIYLKYTTWCFFGIFTKLCSHRHNLLLTLMYLNALGLSCAMCDLSCSTKTLLIAAHRLSCPIRGQTCVPCIARWILNHWTTREYPIKTILEHFDPKRTLYP